jgi:hypothetical protein
MLQDQIKISNHFQPSKMCIKAAKLLSLSPFFPQPRSTSGIYSCLIFLIIPSRYLNYPLHHRSSWRTILFCYFHVQRAHLVFSRKCVSRLTSSNSFKMGKCVVCNVANAMPCLGCFSITWCSTACKQSDDRPHNMFYMSFCALAAELTKPCLEVYLTFLLGPTSKRLELVSMKGNEAWDMEIFEACYDPAFWHTLESWSYLGDDKPSPISVIISLTANARVINGST